jgi:DNA-binding XRE family transcriptional regulator
MELTFSDSLYFYRLRLGLSQAAMAELLEVPLRTFWAWSAGENTPTQITQSGVLALLGDLASQRPTVRVRMKVGHKVRKQVPTEIASAGSLS